MHTIVLAFVISNLFQHAQDPVKPPAKAAETRPAAELKPQAVTFKTDDGVTLAADYYRPLGSRKSPVAILIHMYPADRSSWGPLVPRLHEAGFAVLAYDIRGTGGSVEPKDKQLREKYQRRDPAFFNEAWRDVAAAKDWLAGQDRCDPTRIVLVGASIGCSISINYGGHDEAVKAIVCLSPGTNYMGVNSLRHIKKCGGRSILLISPESEYPAVEELVKASGGSAHGKKMPGGQAQHGTQMLHEPYADRVMRLVVSTVSAAAYATRIEPPTTQPSDATTRPASQ